MPTYTLSTLFSEQDLERFYASGTNIVIAKPSEGGSPNVAWVVYRPLVNNAVEWDEDYGIYASNTDIQNGAKIKQMSATLCPAAIETLYTVNPSGYFNAPVSGGTPNSYSATNLYNNLPKGFLTIGLTQNATVDGNVLMGNVTSAALVQYNYTAVMTPYTTIYIWAQSHVKSSTVVTKVMSPMTKVQFGDGVSAVKLAYQASSGTFIPVGNKAIEGITMSHIMPIL